MTTLRVSNSEDRPGHTDAPRRVIPTTADRVVVLYQRLERLARMSQLEPGEITNGVFAELVDVCTHAHGKDSEAVLADARITSLTPRLRHLCAEGEYRLERFWARRVGAAADSNNELAEFPYLNNYQALTTLEVHNVDALRPDVRPFPSSDGAWPQHVCVLGSGPLPMTALLMSRAFDATVDAVDHDAEATALADAVLPRLSGGHLVRAVQDDARHFAGVAEADVVVLAALVGLHPAAKHAVITAVAHRMRPGTLLLVRSAHRLRTLLYPPLSADDLAVVSNGLLRPLAAIHPFSAVVNSILVAVRC